MNKSLSWVFGGVVSLTAAGHALADVYVVHGINGTDLGLADETLPVDIEVNGTCTELTGVPFRTISDPIPLEPGKYKIKVYLFDETAAPCHGPLAIVKTVYIQFGENSALVAHLTEQGTPTLSKFVNDLRPTEEGGARVSVRHTAAAPPVDVSLALGENAVVLEDIRNGKQRAIEAEPAEWQVTIDPFGEDSIGPIPVGLEADANTIVYAVGSLKNATLEPLVHVLHTEQ